MMVPDYLYYRLTGIMVNETTNASTMQLLNVNTRDFDEDLLSLLQLRRDQFSALAEPNLPAFLNPDSMTLEIQRFCEETEQPIPRTPGLLAKYLQNLKIDEAKRLPEQTTYNLSIIAQSIGYTNMSTFSKAFKKTAGIPPREHRFRHQARQEFRTANA
ncbi:UNVERIFIED_CONTAM: AraC-like DNA-binding protein [Paenibacillus sp. PvR008]